jgi:DNA-binding Lrp family transcriptional regulator
MRDLDDIDRELLRLLLEDARRPWADIADHVDLSPPAVSNRVGRLQELGVIQRFTLHLDRSRLREGTDVLIELRVPPSAIDDARSDVRGLDGVEHVFETADGILLFTATLPVEDVTGYLAGALDLETVEDLEVRLLADREWRPGVGDASLGLSCAECGNTVSSEGVTATVGRERYEFCCPSCRARFEKRHEELKEGV